MLAQLSQWMLIAAIGQGATEASLLKVAPADVDVAVRVRSLEAAFDDATAWLKAMDPDWGQTAEGTLGGQVAVAREHHGERAVKSPFLGLVRLGEQDGGPPPFVILMPSDDYKGTLRQIAGGRDVELKRQDGGYDAFDSPAGNGTWYAADATGVIAFGTSKDLIAEIAKRPAKTLDAVIAGEPAKSFLGGDIGLYVNAASLTKRYGDQIDQARQTFMAALDQAGQQAGNVGTMQMAKDLYGGLFDSLKYADGLTLHLDLAEKGLHLGAFLKVKSDSELAKSIPAPAGTRLADLGRLPAGAMGYAYMNVGARTFDRLMGMNMKMFAGAGKPSPEMEKAIADFHAVGRVETVTSATMGQGLRSIADVNVADPRKYIDASLSLLRAMATGDGARFYKDLKIEPDIQKYEGLTFTHASANLDVEKLAEASGQKQPGQVEAMKALLGDGRLSYWYGTDGKRVLRVLAPGWEDAKSLVDGYLRAGRGVGQSDNFRSVRADLPERASVLTLLEAQGTARMIASLIGGVSRNPNLKAPEDMPREPAYLGASLTPHAGEGYELRLVVPSAVGTVVSKGVLPIFRDLGAAGANP